VQVWVFSHNQGDSARYTLGQPGTNTLFCVGLNPSTAIPNNLDTTLKKVRKIAADNGYDGWLMLNLYPQRETHPVNLHATALNDIIAANQNVITSTVTVTIGRDVWAAWGDDIYKRPYLITCLAGILPCFTQHRWLLYDGLTDNGHPRHPSRVSYGKQFYDFNVREYIGNYGNRYPHRNNL
jgi:hypothetical protein